MIYPFITVGLLVVFVIYILYLAIIKKDIKSKMQTVVLPGLFFIATWVVLYYFLTR